MAVMSLYIIILLSSIISIKKLVGDIENSALKSDEDCEGDEKIVES